jgi:hypothetical protein
VQAGPRCVRRGLWLSLTGPRCHREKAKRPFVSWQRRRAPAESGPSPDHAWRFVRCRRIESDCRKPEGYRCLDTPQFACRQRESAGAASLG